jgi:hypothetical protein
VPVSGSALVGSGDVVATALGVSSPMGAFVITLDGPRYVTLQPAGRSALLDGSWSETGVVFVFFKRCLRQRR